MKAGWKTPKFGDVCELKKGKKPTLQTAGAEGVKPYLVAKYLRGAEPTDFASVSDKNSVSVSANEIIIICDGSNSGETFLGFDGILSSTMAKIGHGNEIDNRFLMHFLDSLFEKFNAAKTGAAIPHLDLAALRDEVLPLPPLPEQNRIVAILDAAFDSIATAKTNAEQNLQNARALFESHLQKVFTERGVGWVETALGEVCDFENGDRGPNYPNRNEYVDSGIPWINTGHIQPDGTLSESEMNFITREKFDSLRSGKIQPGDLVYCLRGATLGKTAIVDPLTIGAVASSLVIIRPSGKIESRFLYYFLTSPVGQQSIKAYENGAAQPNLGAKSVAKYILALPSLLEQRVLISKLDALREETQRLESLYRQKLAALEELKKSLLHRAFSGQL